MAVETALYPSQFNTNWPTAADMVSEGDDHLRLIKIVDKTTWPNVAGAVSASHIELNYVAGVTSAIQTQLNTKGAIAGQTWTGTHVFPSTTTVGPLTPTIQGYLSTVTSDAQAQINAKGSIAGQTWSGSHDFRAGTITVPTMGAADNSTNAASTAFVQSKAFATALPNQTGNAGKFVTTDGSVASWSSTINGDLNFGGTGRRITGDFSNATLTSRASFQTSVANGASVPYLLPNGTSQISGITAVGASDPTNAPYASMYFSGVNAVYEAGANGTGTQPNMVFNVGGAERLRIDTGGNLLVNGVGTGDTTKRAKTTIFSSFGDGTAPNIAVSPIGGIGANQNSGIALYATFGGATTDYGPRRAADIWASYSSFGGGTWGSERLSFGVGNGLNDAFAVTTERLAIDGSGNVLVTGSGGLGYGVGSGGTVTQPTSLTTAVTLNKPSGRVTMFSGLAASQDVVFVVNNTVVKATDNVVLTMQMAALQAYSVEADIPSDGQFRIRVRNLTASANATVPVIGFAILKGAIA